jgi:hypothetical protein
MANGQMGPAAMDPSMMQQQFIEQPDGSVDVIDPQVDPNSDFLKNLADELDDAQLVRISNSLLDDIEIDRNSRKRHDEIYEEGLKRSGLGNDAPGGAKFEGASTAVHPVLAESCVDYGASAIKEIFPPDGPVKIHNFDESVNSEMIEQAEAKRDFLNWQLVEQIPEYRSELEILLTQQPLAGAQYLKVWADPKKNRPCVEFVPTDFVILPYSASSFYTSSRATLIVPLTRQDYESRVKSGLYLDVIEDSDPFIPDETLPQKANDKIEGKDTPMYNEDGLRNFYEVYVTMPIEDEEEPLPYIVTIDEYSRKIVSIYRNWDVEDEMKQKLDWVVEYQFIPWRGAKGVGLAHLIGSLSGAATGALRALLDSAHLSNFPGAVKLKGARASGQNIAINATEITEIEAPANVDDIRKLMMPMPFPQPSTVLFQLLGWLTDAAKGVISTAEEKISDASNQMPVGTTLALIEQGSKVMSSIHMRLHAAQKKTIEIIQRINFKFYDPKVQIKKFGKILVPKEGFLDTANVVPVSDPYMFSEAQRFAQIQGVLQMAQDPAVPWNKLAIYKRLLRLMHVAAPQEFIQEPPPPVSADPVTEIVAAMNGRQIAAQPQMNHMEHIQEELAYLLDPVFGAANPVLINPGFQMIMNDIQQHLLLLFQQMKQQAMQMAQQQVMGMLAQRMQGQVPPEAMQQVMQQQLQSSQAAQIIQQITQQAFAQQQQQLQPMVQALQQADQIVKAKMPPPQDPQAQAMMQVTQMQEQTKMQIAQMREQTAQQNAQIKAQIDQAALQLKAQNDQAKIELEKFVRAQLEPALKQQQMQTEIAKNDADNEQHQRTELVKNHEDNLTNLEIAKVREQGETDRKIEELYQQTVRDILTPQGDK